MSNSMITRSSLVDKLRDYQIRSHHKWSILGLFSHQPFISTWAEVVVNVSSFIICCLLPETSVDFPHYFLHRHPYSIRFRAARKYIARKGDRRMQIPLSM